MPPFILALVIVVGGLWLIRKSARMNPKALSGFMQKAAGGGLMGFAGLLMLRGQTSVATALFAVGAGLYGKSAAFPNGFQNGFKWSRSKSPGQTSTVSTGLLSIELDHDSGEMDGTVLVGPFTGRKLSSLDEQALRKFYITCRASPDQSQALFESWLTREHPNWREAWAGQNNSSAVQASGGISKDEAYAVLGLNSSASFEDIKAAHKRLIKDFHPDKGGSDYLAAKINEAKDKLLNS